MGIPAASENQLQSFVALLLAGKTIVDDDIAPLVVLEESDNVHTVLPEVMEHRRIKPLTHLLSLLIIDLSAVIRVRVKVTTDVSILSGEHTKRTNEPAVSDCSLHDIIGLSTIVEELRTNIWGDDIGADPDELLRVGVAWRWIAEVD